MRIETAMDKINEAQALLEQVYQYYGDVTTDLGRSLSVADTCCEEALEDLDRLYKAVQKQQLT